MENFTVNILLTILLDCKEPSDCPTGGQNYNCTSNVCSCISGHVKDGKACVGMYVTQLIVKRL